MNVRHIKPSILATALFTAGMPMGHSALAAPVGRYVGPNDSETVQVNSGETITGDSIGMEIGRSTITVVNAGTIRGNGSYDGPDALSQGGMNIYGGPGHITNTGSITGAGVGITTNYWYNAATGQLEGRAGNTVVINSGNIAGDSNDGVRMIGGGSVTNNTGGMIFGNGSEYADGISMYPFDHQALTDYHATVTNNQGGIVAGNRMGVILSAGGTINNAGTINGNTFGAYVQGTALNSEERSGVAASITNTGNITGAAGDGVGFGSDLGTADLTNNGQISGDRYGVSHGSAAALTVDNLEDGLITGGRSGLITNGSGSLVLNNAGTIRGNSTYDGFDAPPDAGVTLQAGAGNVINNSGRISGAGAGITTAYLWDEDTQKLLGLAAGTQVTNAGSIWGEHNDGIRLIGGGMVTNSGSVQGSGSAGADGISMYPFENQALADYHATVTNTQTGIISGNRNGVILSAGGTIDNAGTINGNLFGAYIQGTALNSEERSGLSATIINSGDITGAAGDGVGFGSDLASAELTNSGEISGDRYGVMHGSAAALTVDNLEDGVISGGRSGLISNASGSLVLNNAGSIRGKGTYDGFDAPPDAGVTLQAANNVINNSGEISGAGAGITTAYLWDAETQQLLGLAVDTQVTNTGMIVGEHNDGVRLIGGGTVTNSGDIKGFASAGADGISMYAFEGQASKGYKAIVNNQLGGLVEGARYGVAMSGGGEVNNAGEIGGFHGGVLVQGTALDGQETSGATAKITNTGVIVSNRTDGQGYGVLLGSNLASASLINSGEIYSNNYAVMQGSDADAVINNLTGGGIEGDKSGVVADSYGTLTLNNAGVIRGNGTYDGLDALPDAGVVLSTADSSITNSGTISGAGAGITTAYLYDPAVGMQGLAVGTKVENSGTIIGDSNDGVRLIGGGQVVNTGVIKGKLGAGADGVSMYAFTTQAQADYAASVENGAAGAIDGARFGIIMSGGGAVENDGNISGVTGGVFIQGTASNGQQTSGAVGSVINTGTIAGTKTTAGNGYGVGFGSDMASASFINSGTVTSVAGPGVFLGTSGAITLDNQAGGSIRGVYGVLAQGSGELTLTNAGSIAGTGTYEGADAAANAGITLQSGHAEITNSGHITGAGYGIVTQMVYNSQTQRSEIHAIDTTVNNSGTITGQNNDGIRLWGGGTINNLGTIQGLAGELTDGITIQAFTGQDTSDSTMLGHVSNEAGGVIKGVRYGALVVSGGEVTNAGTIEGGLAGLVIGKQSTAGKAAELTNSGSIIGGVELDVDTATVSNTGSIVNANGPALKSLGAVSLTNAGVLSGANGVAAVLSAFDDKVTLKTGSAVTGSIRAGDGVDSLTLSGSGTATTSSQTLGAMSGFESLTVDSGYWTTSGVVGAFDTVDIREGAALQLTNHVTPSGDVFTSVETSTWNNDGRVVLDFAHDTLVDDEANVHITGSGSLELIGEGIVGLDTDTIAHTGGTTIANGGLVLTGTLLGNVTTGGDGYFQLGYGGTEGTFAGDLLNNGAFVFKRSDDYDFNGAFSGTGMLEKYGAGTLSFMGDYDFTGTTTVHEGSVRIGGLIDPETEFDVDGGTLDLSAQNQTIAGLSGGTTSQVAIGSTTLTVNQSGNTVFSGGITGTGNLIKDGDGKLNLTGTNTFTGTTSVNGGILAVNGSVTSPVAVNSGGTLGGNGTVGTTTAGSGGVIAPGNSIGRLTVNGALNFGAGSIYQVEANAAGQADRIDATGAVTIASTAKVDVLAAAGTYNPRTDYTILTGAGGVSGTFGSVSSDLAFLTPYLRYTTGAVTLSLYRNDINFASVATGSNQVSIAKAVQARGINDPLYESLLTQNTSGAQAFFTELSGELLASSVTALTDGSAGLRDALLGVTIPADVGGFVWGSAIGGSATFDAKDGMRSLDMDQRGMLVGAGMRGQWLSGAIGIGGGSADITIPGGGDRADVSSRHVVAELVHGGDHGLKITLGGASSKHDMDTHRMVAVGGVQTLTGTRDVTTSQYFGEVGYGFAGKVLRVTPFVRAAKVSSKADAMVETGGVAALRVGAIDQDITQTSVGARLQFDNTISGVHPYLSAAWTRTSGDLVPVATGNFASGGTGFTVSGMAIPKTSTEVQAGISLQTKGWQWNAGYNGRLSSHRDVHSFALNVSYKF